MSEIEFTKEEKEVLVNKIKSYFGENLEQEIGQFDAEFLLPKSCKHYPIT